MKEVWDEIWSGIPAHAKKIMMWVLVVFFVMIVATNVYLNYQTAIDQMLNDAFQELSEEGIHSGKCTPHDF